MRIDFHSLTQNYPIHSGLLGSSFYTACPLFCNLLSRFFSSGWITCIVVFISVFHLSLMNADSAHMLLHTSSKYHTFLLLCPLLLRLFPLFSITNILTTGTHYLTLRSININIYLYISLAGYTSYQLMTDAEELHLGKKR